MKTNCQATKASPAAPPVAAPRCYTRKEFSVVIRLSERTVDRMIAAGEVAVLRPHGRAVRIPCTEAERYLTLAASQSLQTASPCGRPLLKNPHPEI